MTPSRTLFALLLTCFASTASAGDFVIGVGAADFSQTSVPTIELEYHSDPVWRFAGADISVSGTIVADDNSDVFVGLGLSALRPLRNDWFVEASFTPGYFRNSDPATDLGNDLEFRTLIGLGRKLSNGKRVSLGLSHKSNAGIGNSNPGVNALTLRVRF